MIIAAVYAAVAVLFLAGLCLIAWSLQGLVQWIKSSDSRAALSCRDAARWLRSLHGRAVGALAGRLPDTGPTPAPGPAAAEPARPPSGAEAAPLPSPAPCPPGAGRGQHHRSWPRVTVLDTGALAVVTDPKVSLRVTGAHAAIPGTRPLVPLYYRDWEARRAARAVTL